jgi:hypothetical protein
VASNARLSTVSFSLSILLHSLAASDLIALPFAKTEAKFRSGRRPVELAEGGSYGEIVSKSARPG